MDTYMLSQIRNWKNNNAGIPDGYEVAAVIDAVMDGWDFGCVQATAGEGVAEADAEGIKSLIEQLELSCEVNECEKALVADAEATR